MEVLVSYDEALARNRNFLNISSVIVELKPLKIYHFIKKKLYIYAYMYTYISIYSITMGIQTFNIKIILSKKNWSVIDP